MTKPAAYEPEQGYMFQILCRNGSGAWEHCDYAKSIIERNRLCIEYRIAYGIGWQFKTEQLPRRYWPTNKDQA